MKPYKIALFSAASFLLSACASGVGEIALAPPEDEPSAYGAFLAARYAGVQADVDGAADLYAEALRLAPGDPTLVDRAFYTALLAGEIDRASELAADAIATGDESRLATLYYAADRLADRRYRGTVEILDAAPDYGPFNAFLAHVLEQWAMVGRGEGAAALEAASGVRAPGYMATHLSFHRALLADAAGQSEAAENTYRAAVYASPFRRLVTESYGEFLEREGRRGDAAALYREYLETAPDEASIAAALERVESGRRAPRALSPAQGAARAMFGPIQALALEADLDLTVLYLRMIQRLDDSYMPARLLLGGALERVELEEAALQAYASVEDGPFASGARASEIMLTARMGRLEQATLMAERHLASEDTPEARVILADLFRYQGDCARAVPLYADAIAAEEAQGEEPYWARYYWQAVCLDISGDWDGAEQVLQRAVARHPEEAELLNHLAYGWIERGERMDEAMAMIQRAALLMPNNGAIIDSLGWAQYRTGDYEEAVETLETAASLSPGSATINAHLGDAYWRVGRRLEARFQWRRALDLDASPAEIEALQSRLAEGLDDPVMISPDRGGMAAPDAE